MSLSNRAPRLGWGLLILGGCAAAFYLYLAHLGGAMPSYTDENRALHYTRFSPLLYVMCAPFTHALKNYDVPFYIMGFCGILNVLLVYGTTRLLFSQRIGILAALFYLFFDYPLAYAKTLYSSTPVTMYLLLALFFFVLSEKRRNANYVLLSGVFSGLMIMTNASSYAMLAGFVLFMILFKIMRLKSDSPITLRALLWRYGAGLLIPCVLIDPVLMWKYPGRGWFESLLNYRQVTLEVTHSRELGPAGVLSFWEKIFNASFKSASQLARNIFVTFCAAAGMFIAFARHDKKTVVFFLMAITGAGILFMNCGLGLHTIAPRHFIWTSVFFGAAFAVTADCILRRRSRILRTLGAGALLVYALLAVQQCVQAPGSLSSYNDIRSYLEEREISLAKTVTMWPLGSYRDNVSGNAPSMFPRARARSADGRQGALSIFWPAMVTAYRDGQITHCLSSGYGSFKTVGNDDFVLEGVEPLASWPHPLNNRFIHFAPENHTLRLYAMEDIYRSLMQKSSMKARR